MTAPSPVPPPPPAPAQAAPRPPAVPVGGPAVATPTSKPVNPSLNGMVEPRAQAASAVPPSIFTKPAVPINKTPSPPPPPPPPVSPANPAVPPPARPALPNMPPASIGKVQEPEDIFAKANLGKGGPSYPHGAETVASIAESPGRGLMRKLARLIFFAAGAGVIVVAGYFGYQYFMAAQAPAVPQVPDTNAPAVNENVPTDTASNANANVPLGTVNENVPAVLAPADDPNSSLDSDSDGLTDYQETRIFMTDPLRLDTDADGLTDRDEALVWHSDPRNSDTDADGYADGSEVTNNYNPIGPGKLPDKSQ